MFTIWQVANSKSQKQSHRSFPILVLVLHSSQKQGLLLIKIHQDLVIAVKEPEKKEEKMSAIY